MNKLSKYKKYTADTQTRMAEIEDSIVERYCTVPSKFNSALFLLADNLDLLAECRASVAQDGIMLSDGRRNPIVVSISSLSSNIAAQLKALGCTPYAEGLLKSDEGEDTEDFINNLTK